MRDIRRDRDRSRRLGVEDEDGEVVGVDEVGGGGSMMVVVGGGEEGEEDEEEVGEDEKDTRLLRKALLIDCC